jgi:PAS domain S-box-containing protein
MPLSTHPDLADLIVRNVKAYAIVVLSEDGVVPEWSGEPQAVTGYAAGDIVGRSFDILFTKPDRAAGVAAQEIELALRDGRAEDSRWHPCDRRRGPGRDLGAKARRDPWTPETRAASDRRSRRHRSSSAEIRSPSSRTGRTERRRLVERLTRRSPPRGSWLSWRFELTRREA